MSEAMKIVINLNGQAASVGIQKPECDPFFSRVEGDLTAVLEAIPSLVEQARQGWEASARYPKCQTPMEPPPKPAITQGAAPRQAKTPQQAMF
jgi:hypothetical protein